jgi:transposase
MPHRFYLGVDIAKATFAVALLEETVSVSSGEFANDLQGFRSLCTWYKSQIKVLLKHSNTYVLHVGMEATGRYGEALATYLHEQFAHSAHFVSVINPHLTSAYAKSRKQRNKTDKLDAENIAYYCAKHEPEPWQPLTEEQLRLKELTRYQESIETTMTQEKLRLQSGLRDKSLVRRIKKHLKFLEGQRKEIEEEIASLCKQNDHLNTAIQLIDSIPGIGFATAAKVLAEVPRPQNFETAAQLVAYSGLAPVQTQSGTSVRRKGRLSKQGNKHLRTALYMPTLAAMRRNPIIKTLTDRLKNAGKHPMSAVAAGMRKLLTLIFGVLKSGRPFDPNYALSHQNA